MYTHVRTTNDEVAKINTVDTKLIASLTRVAQLIHSLRDLIYSLHDLIYSLHEIISIYVQYFPQFG